MPEAPFPSDWFAQDGDFKINLVMPDKEFDMECALEEFKQFMAED